MQTRIYILIAVLAFVFSEARSADRYWIAGATSNWNNTANWSTTSGGAGGATVPGSADKAIFNGSGLGSCNIDAAVNVAGFDMQSTYTGTVSQGTNSMTIGTSNAVFAGGTFTGGSANITISGSFTHTGTAFTSTSATLNIRNTCSFTNANFTHNNGTVTFSMISGTGFTISGSVSLYKLTLAGSGLSAITYTIASGTTLTVSNTLSYTGAKSITVNTGTIDVTGNISLSNSAAGGGDGLIKISGSGTQTVTGYTSSGGSRLPKVEIDKSGGSLTLSNYLTVGNNWTFTGMGGGTFSPGSSTVVFNVSNTITGTHALNNVTFDGTGTTYTIAAGNTLTVNGTLQTTGTGSLTLNGNYIEATGNILISNTGSGGGGNATLRITGGNNQSFTGSASVSTGRLCNIYINKSGGTLTLSNSISTVGSWEHIAGTVDAATNQPTNAFQATSTITAGPGMQFYFVTISGGTVTLLSDVSILGNLSIGAGSGISAGTYTIYLGGSWSNSGTFTPGTSRVICNGTGQQQIRNRFNAETFYNLEANNSTGFVDLQCPVIVTNELELNAGRIVTTSTNILTLNDNAFVTGGGDVSYVMGPMKKIGDDAFTFPLGDNTVSGPYHPLSISAPSSATDTYIAQYYPSAQAYGTTLDAPLVEISSCEYWTLQRTAGTSNVTTGLGWNSNSCNGSDYNTLRVAYWDGTDWNDLGTPSVSGGTSGTVTGSSLLTFPLSPTPLVIGNKAGGYVMLDRTLNGAYYNSTGSYLMVKYEEEYADTDGSLSYDIYDYNRTSQISETTQPQSAQKGYNKTQVNVSGLASGYYVMEVRNEKGEVRKLRFKR